MHGGQQARDNFFADMNKNVYSGSLARALQSDGLLMEEQTLRSTGKEAVHSNKAGQVPIFGTTATAKITCPNS